MKYASIRLDGLGVLCAWLMLASCVGAMAAPSIFSARVSPDSLSPGDFFSVTVQGANIDRGSVFIDFRPHQAIRMRLPLHRFGNDFAASARLPLDFNIAAPVTVLFSVIVEDAGRTRAQGQGLIRIEPLGVPPPAGMLPPGPLNLAVRSPANDSATKASTVEVRGEAVGARTVAVNGIVALVNDGRFSAANVPLAEGENVIVVTASDDQGSSISQTIRVRRDTTPPQVVIETPTNGARLVAPAVVIAGTVNDIIPGAQVNADDVFVTINGRPATVNNRSFFLNNLALDAGPNTITAVAVDRVGNTATQSITVTREEDLAGVQILITGGNGQMAPIATTLPAPLAVKLQKNDGTPLAGRPVKFMVSRGDGALNDPADNLREFQVLTDVTGAAQATFTVGSRTGEGFHRVRVTTPGSLSFAEFCATARATNPANIAVAVAPPKQAAAGLTIINPISAIVTDPGGNPVSGVAVTFTIEAGDGDFDGNNSVTVSSNMDGVAEAQWTLGPDPGVANNEASATFAGNPGLPAVFTTSGMGLGNAGETTVGGTIQDSGGQPIVGAKAVIRGTDPELAAFTGADGRFLIRDVAPGGQRIGLIGSTADDPANGKFFASIDFEVEVLSGVANELDQVVVLPFLDRANAKEVGGDSDQILTMAGVDGFSVKVFAHSTFKRDPVTGLLRQQPVLMSSSQVKFNKMPMPPPQGSTPLVIGTLQPTGIVFNPPAEVCYPNAEGLAPGDVADVFAFHVDIGQFVNIGPGTVTDDGAQVCSDPGFGIVQSGWHCLIRMPGPAGNCRRINDCTATWTWTITANGAGQGSNKPVLMCDTGDPAKKQKAKVTVTFNPAGTLEGNWSVNDASVAKIVSQSGATVTLEAVGPGATTITSPTNRITVEDGPDKTCQAQIEVKVNKIGSLEATLASTQNPVDKTRPAAGTFQTTNRSLDYVPAAAADLMTVVKGAGDVKVMAKDVQPASAKAQVRWKVERNPADTVEAGTGIPSLSSMTGEMTTLTPDKAGNFRLIAFIDKDGDNAFDAGEECRVLRMAIIKFTLQAGHFIKQAVVFNPAASGVSTTGAMNLQADFLLEGGGADRRVGVDRVVLGNVGTVTADSFKVTYPVPMPVPPAPGNVVGMESEDPDFKQNPAAGFASPMVDTVNVAQGNQPTGGSTPFRGNSADTNRGNGPGGKGQLRRITSLDAPGFGWNNTHPTTKNLWGSTSGANAFKEYLVVYSLTFPRNYSVLATGSWTVNVIGNRTAGKWKNSGSNVTIPSAMMGKASLTSSVGAGGTPTTGDTAGLQALGFSFVKEFGLIVTP